jgi:XRE family aerobic/anaerobic benzoate catabolism transcriptional regulator
VSKAAPKHSRPDPWLIAVGERLRIARKAAGLTQEQLAEASELAPRTIQKIEAGRITVLITTLRRLRRALGCGFQELLPDD